MQETLVVRREQHVPAPPAVVFAFLTDPEKILRWMGTEANVEPHPGGLYLVNVTGARLARGSFREVVPVHRLAYSFGWDGSEVVPPESSLVEIDLVEQPDGTAAPAGCNRFPLWRFAVDSVRARLRIWPIWGGSRRSALTENSIQSQE